MAKPRSSRTRSLPPVDDSNRAISESARQIWLAGIDAFQRTQREGSKLLETLLLDGLVLDRRARKRARSTSKAGNPPQANTRTRKPAKSAAH